MLSNFSRSSYDVNIFVKFLNLTSFYNKWFIKPVPPDMILVFEDLLLLVLTLPYSSDTRFIIKYATVARNRFSDTALIFKIFMCT